MLRQRDYHLLLDAVHELNQTRTLDEFRPAARRVTAELIGCETASFNEIDTKTGSFLGLLQPISQSENDRLVPLLLRYLHQNPAVLHLLQNPDSTTLCVTDFIAQRDFRRTALYREVFRCVAIERQAMVGLGMHGSANVCVTLHRARRAFSSREVAILDALRPHLIQAYDNTRHFSHTRYKALHARTLDERAQDRVLVVNQGHIVFCSEDARWILCRFFGDFGRFLPLEIARWLRAQNANSLFLAAPLQLEKAGRVLVVRRNGTSEDGVLLLLQEVKSGKRSAFAPLKTDFVARDISRSLGLTSRQSEVLELVSRGLSNGEIAQQLQISAHTVRHHLEAIYEILGVSNRHAAANVARCHFSLNFSHK